jgi:hypothetical protein
MRVRIVVEAELQHVTGKFAARDEVEEILIDELENVDPGEVSGVGEDGETEYEIVDWQVSAMEPARGAGRIG